MYTYGYNPRTYGATGGGVVDDSAAFTAANTAAAGDAILVSSGTYLISSSIVITCPIFFAAGAELVLSGGATATFSYTPQAGRYQIFSGTALTSAAVLMAPTTVTIDPLYPEWWGAQPGNTGFDNGPAFNYCGQALQNIVNGSAISLGAGNYVFATSVSWVGLSNFAAFGQGSGVTTLSFPNGFGSMGITVGGASSGSPTQNITLRDLQINQTLGAGPIGPTTGLSGLLVQYSIRTILENLIVLNWGGGISYKSCIDCLSHNIYCETNYAQTAAYGFYLDGSTSQNASMYFTECLCSHNAPLSSIYTYGLYSFCGSAGSIADLYCTTDIAVI